jgi:hypothetical protein
LASRQEIQEKYSNLKELDGEASSSPSNELKAAKSQYSNLKKNTEDLTQRAIALKESHPNGAIDSINGANRLSQDTDYSIQNLENNFENNLKPLVEQLQQRLDNSKETFETSDSKLKNHFDSIEKDLKNSLESIDSLNGAVCGGQTTFINQCHNKCGGAGCSNCGTNTSECSGLVDSYWNVVNLRNSFNELYSKQESIFKKILTKLRVSSSKLTNSNREVKELLKFANESLHSINEKKSSMESLIATVLNFTTDNEKKPDNIKSNCEYAKSNKLDLDEADLDATLNEIAKIASTIDSTKIERETATSQRESQNLIANSDRIGSYLPNTLAEFERTKELYQKEENKTKQNEQTFEEFININDKIQNDLSKVNFKLEYCFLLF